MSETTYTKLIRLLDDNKADYRLIDHEAEGRTELVSAMRGNDMKQAANCIILMVKIGKKEKKYVLSVYPADKRLDMNAVKNLFGGKYVAFADKDKAEALAGSVLGTVLPFPMSDEVEFIVDPGVIDNDEIFFNAAKLDQSVALKASDYERIAQPRLEPIVEGSTPKAVKKESGDDNELMVKRHSLSHAMSQAVMELYPDAKRGVGPAIDKGFYQDFDFGENKVSEEDLKTIEKKTKNILKQNQKFEQNFISIDEGLKHFASDPYKVELIEDLKKDGETNISIYTNYAQNGDKKYEDLCKGPHVDQFSKINPNAFQIEKIAGAYWRGDANNTMMTRIYGIAFDSREELDAYNKLIREAKKRDHRVLGKKLGLFTFSDLVGSGLPLFTPKGASIRNRIEEEIMRIQSKYGFEKVWIPHITKKDLYEKSGHWDKFKEDLFHVCGKSDTEFVMKPMNCPHHAQIYASDMRSYKDLPIRYAETTTCYRDEQAGELLGLSRVRSLTQDDGHIFCRIDQVGEEAGNLVNVVSEFYTKLGMFNEGDFWVSLSVRDPETPEKYLGDSKHWEKAETFLEEVAKEKDLPYKRVEGEAAFYGPKLDFMFRDSIGREWQLSTVQIDFVQPERFELEYIDQKGNKQRPVMIHRAIAGSLERFMSVIIEHFAGAFPLWLAPTQMRIIPVSSVFDEYANSVAKKLKIADLRVEVDDGSDGLNKKVRNAEKDRINYILIVGEQEMKSDGVAVRNYKTKEQTEERLDDFIERIQAEL